MKTQSRSARCLLLWMLFAPVAGIVCREVLHRENRQAGQVATSENRRFQTVVIDPGHGGEDSGALSRFGGGIREKDLTLAVAQKLAVLLKAENIRVVLTRQNDRFVSLPERTEIANREKNAIFVSIHFNDTPDATANGVETYRAGMKNPLSRAGFLDFLRTARVLEDPHHEEALAAAVQTEMVEATHGRDRGVKEQNFFVVRNVTCPAILVEGGFVSNEKSALRLRSSAYQETLAEALARGILRYRENKTGLTTLLARRN